MDKDFITKDNFVLVKKTHYVLIEVIDEQVLELEDVIEEIQPL